MNIKPSKRKLEHWIKEFVPDKDLFFLTEKDISTIHDYLHGTLVMPKEEFLNHSTYKQIQLVNSYEYWKISKKVQCIIVANSDWFTDLPVEIKRILNHIQIQNNRGLILPLSFPNDCDVISEENLVVKNEQQYIVLQSNMWRTLPFPVKERIIESYAKGWESWTCYNLPEQAPKHLQKYANSFPTSSGSNCLAATLFAITEQEWIIHEWVHPQTFREGLTRSNYFPITTDKLIPGDVLTWINEEEVIQHASFYVGNDLFFNKNGQTFFNPWKVECWLDLNHEWGDFDMKVYRNK